MLQVQRKLVVGLGPHIHPMPYHGNYVTLWHAIVPKCLQVPCDMDGDAKNQVLIIKGFVLELKDHFFSYILLT